MMTLWMSLACGATPEVETKEETVEVREGRASLEQHITVPEGLDEVRWVARPKGSGELGPTDLVLLAAFAVEQPPGERTGDGEVQPDGVLAAALGVTTPLSGAHYSTEPFENIRWTGGFAVYAEGVLLVELHSR